MSGEPRVTVGLPLRNEERCIEEALYDLLKQDYPNLEFLISDNASSDKTGEICRKRAQSDSRIKYERLGRPVDANENFNRLVRQASGDYFMWASGHDGHASNYVSRLLKPFFEDQTVVLSYSDILPMNAEGKKLSVLPSPMETRGINGPMLRCLLSFWHLGGYQIYGLFRLSAMKQTRLFRPYIMGPDLIMLSELAMIGTFACCRQPLYFPRYNWTDEADAARLSKLVKRYDETMFFGKKLGKYPAWDYFRSHLAVVVEEARGFRRKALMLPLFATLFLIKNHTMLLDDLRKGKPNCQPVR